MFDEQLDHIATFIELLLKTGLELNVENFPFSRYKDFLPSNLENIGVVEKKWYSYIENLIAKNKKNTSVKLGKNQRDIKIPSHSKTSWKIYENNLKKQGWTAETITNIRESSREVLSYLKFEIDNSGANKGLVIGNVQSGKTANMAGVIALAADYGFNFFIVLSGTIENLRKQTSNRLFKDLNGSGNLNWQLIENPNLRNLNADQNISNFLVGETDKNRYLTVCLKQKDRLNNLIDWIYSDKNKAKQLKVLVIDDEADQASINTNNLESDDPTTINKLIKKLVNDKMVGCMNYIAYTATPYANILNESSKESLYPKDFILVLPQSPDYIGPTEMFGSTEPDQNPKVDIIKEIPENDVKIIREIKNGNSLQIPNSLKSSINWFIISLAAMRAIGYQKPVSMLIHTTFKIDEHNIIAKNVENYLRQIKRNQDKFLNDLKEMYIDESLDFSKKRFLQGMENYSVKEEDIPDYPNWDVIEMHIKRIFRLDDTEYVSHVQISENGEPKYHEGIHIAIDNSKANSSDEYIRLVYPSKPNMTKQAPGFIVIGGNTLSRGLTLEGLVSTFFLRTTSQADTLMQMGRWFGYRKGYELFPRVWLENSAHQKFEFLSQLNYELREDMKIYSEKHLTPMDVAPIIKNSPDYQLIRITSKNKMQSAFGTEFNFIGYNTQTVIFKDENDKLKHNINITKEFLNSLPNPKVQKSNLIWKNIDNALVESFFREYYICEEDIKSTLIPELINWLKENKQILSNWNIVLSSKGKIEYANRNDEWNIQGYKPNSVQRSKKVNSSTNDIVTIGVLRQVEDQFADLDVDKLSAEERKLKDSREIQILRDKHGFGQTPLLVIYKIDKNSLPKETKTNTRAKLNFSEDIIGIYVSIPSYLNGNVTNINGRNFAQKLSQKVEKESEEEFYEEM